MLGVLCAVCCFLSYAAPIEQVRITILEKHPRYIDMTVITACLLNSVFWVSYGALRHNYYIVLPSTGGFLVSLLQVVVYLWATERLPQATCSALQNCLRSIEPAKLIETCPLNSEGELKLE